MEILVYSGLELLGDGVMKLPFVRALRYCFPSARITWLAGKGKTVYAGTLAPLVGDCLDEVIEEAGIGSRAGELLRRPLADRRFDLVIDTQRRVLTSLILRRIRAKCFVSGAADFLLSSRRPPRGTRKPPSMIGQLFALLGLAAGHPVAPVFDLALDASWRDRAAALLPRGPLYVGLAPGAGGAHKRWPRERFVALAQAQIAAGREAVFLLGPDESDWLGALRGAVPGALFPLQLAAPAGDPASPLLTLAVAQRLAAAVANDSGTGHLIAAAGCPLVSLFGPTRAEKFAPAARRLEIVEAQDFGASDMDAIPLDAVAAALERVLAAGAADDIPSGYMPSGT
ncbi:MAG TPA: glycosyltransferase family 9 protein [Stellaceae bacterium]|jgi:ADP-heptose:LPS heptosyltransferase|nr:glycosyltransferase family 9 protein [Stellaceae bacterium]